MKRLDLSNKLKALNESMTQTEFVQELRKTFKIKDLKGDVVQKAYEFLQKGVAKNPIGTISNIPGPSSRVL